MARENQRKNDNLEANTVKTERKSIARALSETRKELKKVHWPTNKELYKYTVVTLVTVAFFSVSIYIIDTGLGFVISKLVNK